MKQKRSLLIAPAIVTAWVCFWSLASLLKLGALGDGDPINTPLRILNRDVAYLSFGLLLVIVYLWLKDNDSHNS